MTKNDGNEKIEYMNQFTYTYFLTVAMGINDFRTVKVEIVAFSEDESANIFARICPGRIADKVEVTKY